MILISNKQFENARFDPHTKPEHMSPRAWFILRHKVTMYNLDSLPIECIPYYIPPHIMEYSQNPASWVFTDSAAFLLIGTPTYSFATIAGFKQLCPTCKVLADAALEGITLEL